MSALSQIKELVTQQKCNVKNEQLFYKERIKQELLNNELLIYALNNKTVDDPDELFGTSIKPHVVVPETISEVENFILYDVDTENISESNDVMRIVTIKFMILCDEKNNIDKDTGVARHDLIGTILKEKFNWDRIFGNRVKLRSDRAAIIDAQYVARTLIFEQITINGALPNSSPKR